MNVTNVPRVNEIKVDNNSKSWNTRAHVDVFPEATVILLHTKKKRIFEEPERKENESSHHDFSDVISARGASIIANLLVNDKR